MSPKTGETSQPTESTRQLQAHMEQASVGLGGSQLFRRATRGADFVVGVGCYGGAVFTGLGRSKTY